MIKTVKALAVLGAVWGLTACGGGEAARMAQQPQPTQTFAAAERGSPGASFRESTSTVEFYGKTISSLSDTKVESPSLFVHAYRGNALSPPQGSGLITGTVQTIRSNSGKTHAFAFGNKAQGVNFTQFGRSTPTVVPLTGQADYAGNYLGMTKCCGRDAGALQDFLILGDSNLAVDFGAGTVSGRITNRRMSATPSVTFDDVALNAGKLDSQGFFKGSAVGGRLIALSGSNRPARVFEGLIGGDTGEELAGYVRTNWTGAAGLEYAETGVFEAKKQ